MNLHGTAGDQTKDTETGRKRCLVLVVDDNRGDARLAQEAIRGDEFEVALAASGAAALEAIGRRLPDVVLLDLILPDMDGAEVLARIRANEATRDTPVIIVTGKSDVDDVVAGLSLGATDYVTKPYHPEIVCARIRVHHAAKLGRDEIMMVVGGVVPPDDVQTLKDMVAAAVYPPGAVVAETAIDMLGRLNERLGYAQLEKVAGPA